MSYQRVFFSTGPFLPLAWVGWWFLPTLCACPLPPLDLLASMARCASLIRDLIPEPDLAEDVNSSAGRTASAASVEVPSLEAAPVEAPSLEVAPVKAAASVGAAEVLLGFGVVIVTLSVAAWPCGTGSAGDAAAAGPG